jgi:hypothetical protein
MMIMRLVKGSKLKLVTSRLRKDPLPIIVSLHQVINHDNKRKSSQEDRASDCRLKTTYQLTFELLLHQLPPFHLLPSQSINLSSLLLPVLLPLPLM